jgi:hypothetical protein
MNRAVSYIAGNEWLLATSVAVLLLMLTEAGHRLGRRLRRRNDDARLSQILAIQGAVLGMLGLLLGFTFSMAVSRYEARRELVVREANAIGTTWLRASLLPEEHMAPVKSLLRDYVDLRLETYRAAREPERLGEGIRRGAEIQSRLWQHAEASAREAPTPITETFITTLNELIDIDAERIAAARNQIPAGVWLILVVVAAAGCWTSGYAAGSYSVRTPLTGVLLPLLISIVILLIFDLAHGRQGVISVSQQSLIDIQNSIGSGRR